MANSVRLSEFNVKLIDVDSYIRLLRRFLAGSKLGSDVLKPLNVAVSLAFWDWNK